MPDRMSHHLAVPVRDAEADPDVGPWSGFAPAAAAAVRDLHGRFGLDLWMVTHVDGERQVVVASAGGWSTVARPGAQFTWASSFCEQVARRGPVAARDVRRSPALAAVAVGDLARVRAYVGVPLLSGEGRLFGTLCAYAGQPQAASLTAVLPPVQLLGRMLSTILASQQMAADRSQDAAQAYALAERDRLTGLRNLRGWQAALTTEQQRSQRYGSATSVLAVDINELKALNALGGHAAGDAALTTCAAVLQSSCRQGDVLARTGGDELGLLAVECDAVSARALAVRLRVGLRVAGVATSVGAATRRPHEGLDSTWRRAQEAGDRERRRRERRRAVGSVRLVDPSDLPG